jgi:hypothetical protein
MKKFISIMLLIVTVTMITVCADAAFASPDMLKSISWFDAGAGTSLAMPIVLFAFAYSDLPEPDETVNVMGGFTVGAYVAIVKEIATFPALTTTPADPEDLIDLVGNYTMETDKYFFKVYSTDETTKLIAESQGDLDGKSFKLTGELFYPGTSSEALGIAKRLNNTRVVIILLDDNGDRFIIGTKERPCYLSSKTDWGQKTADRKGITFEFTANSYSPALKYYGPIPLSAGQIDPIS